MNLNIVIIVLTVLLLPLAQLGAQPPAGSEPQVKPEPEQEKLPTLEELSTPTVEQLLNERPQDWILLNTNEVLIVESLVPRPGTLEKIEKEIKDREEERRSAKTPEEREAIQQKINDLNQLYVILPGAGSPEFKLPLRRVRGIIHHEDLMLRRIHSLLDENNVDQALELLTRLERSWDEWPGMLDAHERILFVDAGIRMAAGQTESALMLLDELYIRKKQYPGLEARTGEAIQTVVEEAISRNDFLQAQYFLNYLQQRFPQHAVYKKFDAELSQRTQTILDKAGAAAEQGDQRQAAILADEAARVWPRTKGLRGPHRVHTERYQRLHVGVIDLPGGTDAYPLPSAADLRLRTLTQLPLFEIARVRDGTAYYRTRFFDEWEPFDLGREMKFTLKQFRQPSEMQAIVSTSDVVTPILHRLDPSHANYDERLATFIDSVIIESPTEFSLTFQRVPPRLEPLLTQIFVGGKEDDPIALAPLKDPGGFKVVEQTDHQLICQRKLKEPNGLPKYHVAEVVEHKYDSYEKAVQALYRGEVSMLPDLPDWIIRRMQNDDQFVKRFFIQKYLLPQTHLLQFNPESKPLKVRELRTALAYAVDRETLLRETVLQDPRATHGRIVTTPFLSSSPGRNVLVEPRRYDLSSALAMSLASQRLLKGKIPKLTMVVAPGIVPEAAANRIAGVWRRIGLDIDVVLADDPPPKSWDILYRTIQMTEPIVEIWPFLTFSDRARLSDLDLYPDWLKQELVELDRTSDQRRAVLGLQKLHRHLWDAAAYVPLWEVDQFLVLRKNIQGFPQRPVHCYDQVDLWTVDAWYQTESP